MAWDCAERLAVAVQSPAGSRVLLYATQLRPIMTAQLVGTVSSGSQSTALQTCLSMHASSHGAVLALQQTKDSVALVPLLYRD